MYYDSTNLTYLVNNHNLFGNISYKVKTVIFHLSTVNLEKLSKGIFHSDANSFRVFESFKHLNYSVLNHLILTNTS